MNWTLKKLTCDIIAKVLLNVIIKFMWNHFYTLQLQAIQTHIRIKVRLTWCDKEKKKEKNEFKSSGQQNFQINN